MHKCEIEQVLWDHTAESVGVNVKKCNIFQVSQLFWEAASNVCIVQINASNHKLGGIMKGRSTIHTIVRANIFTYPVAGDVQRVGINGLLPCLKSNMGLLQSFICFSCWWWNKGFIVFKFYFGCWCWCCGWD